jgi:hypothetical protein
VARRRPFADDDQAQGAWNQQSPFQDQEANPGARYEQPVSRAYADPNAEGPAPTAAPQGGMQWTGQQGYNPAALTEGMQRRGGGNAGRAVGGLVGGIAGSLIPGANIVPGLGSAVGGLVGSALGGGRRAATASTDYSVEDARQAIINGYQSAFGRVPSQNEVDTHLMNVGWRPGHRFVGEMGLNAILGGLPAGAQNSDVQALQGPAAPGAAAATTGTTTTGTTSTSTAGAGAAGGSTRGWGFTSATGGRGEFDFTPIDYGMDMTGFSGFSPMGEGSSDPTALKNIFRNAAAGLGGGEGGFTEQDLDEVIRRLNAMGIPASKVDPYQIDFGLGEGPMQVRSSKNEVWWNNRATEGGPEGASGDAEGITLKDSTSQINALTKSYSYESLIPELVASTLKKK